MTDATAPEPKTLSTWRGIRGTVAEHPVAAAIALYAIVVIAAGVAAYLRIFTGFAGYDDEGTLLVTVKAFAHGEVLYREIYSEYGPFYYELFGGLFALTGHAVTTDASRSIVIVVWVTASLLFGLACQRLTGRLMLGVAAMVVAFAALTALVNEPMHPQGLAMLLLGAFSLLAVSGPGRRVAVVGGAGGALVAALALTKVNLGAFALAAIVLAAVLTVEPLYRRRWIRWPVIVAFLAMPVFVLQRDLRESWVRDLMLLEILASAAILVAAGSVRPKRGEDEGDLRRWLLAAGIGFALAAAAIVGIVLLTGPTLADVYDGVIGNAIRVRDVLVTPLPLAVAAVDWAVIAVAAAAVTVRLRPLGNQALTVWPGLLRAVAGLTIWFTVAGIAPVAFNPSAGNPDVLPMALAWVAAIPPLGAREPAYRRFLRILLPALAVAETLQVYPVAGSQMAIASLAFVPVGALCLSDALTCLRAWSAARGAEALERFGAVVAVAAVALAGLFALDSIGRQAASNAVLYRDQPTLSLPGASLLHLPQAEIETYEGVVQLLHRYRCTTFVGYPNIDSFYLWSGLEAPGPPLPGAWMDAIDAELQQRIVNEMRASPRPCVIRSDSRAELWLHGVPPPERPLVRYIFNDFAPVAQAGDFQFLLPKAHAQQAPS
ncbi:MAG TPA: hypothetical protein VHU14_04790 [Solirubrobacterales bacterium]|nr:hypothetical protein [Solirubrobacterales bacterium]